MQIRNRERCFDNSATMGRSSVLVARGICHPAINGHLAVGGMRFPCAFGRSGRRIAKREGDGATPIGTWRLESVYYRRDRGPRPVTGLPVRVIRPGDGWCDAPTDRNYNRFVRHPYPASAEHLWRDDHLYDLLVVLDHNRAPARRGAGSAIFMHVARAGFAPTEGCIALRSGDLRRVLAQARPGTSIVIST